MKATQQLSTDHRLIERVLSALEVAAEQLGRGETVAPAFFHDAVRFIRGFADGTHHRKEEDVLFPALADRGMPVEGGPIGVMLYEHDQGRQFTAAMSAAADALEAGESRAEDALVANALGYATLLRQHICKEDHILFAMAERFVPPAEQGDLDRAFDAIDAAQGAGETRADYERLVKSLEARVAVAHTA